MQRVCLATMRLCLSAWLGISVFFVMLTIGLHHSPHFPAPVKFDFPKVLFPLYYGFEFSLLGTAFGCACVGMWNGRVGKVRRLALLAFLFAGVGLALLDYLAVYRKLVVILSNPTEVPAMQFVESHETSRRLNMIVLALTTAATTIALWPEMLNKPESSAV